MLFLAPSAERAFADRPEIALVEQYCIGCHSSAAKTAGLDLESELGKPVTEAPDAWEPVVRRLRARQMPPAGMPRPDEATYVEVLTSLETALDEASSSSPRPGRTETFRRLTRTEYQNSIRDLLGLEIDGAALLPADESSHGFDNITVGELSPTLMDRYVSAAEKISRLAVGRASRDPGGETFRIPPDLTQERRLDGMPIGSRGGAAIPYNFPVDGEYGLSVRLARDRNEEIEGLSDPARIEILLDRKLVEQFDILPPADRGGHAVADQHLKVRLPVKAGPHTVAATFLKQPTTLVETTRRPYQARFNYYRHPRLQPAVYSMTILGPFSTEGPGASPSRRRLFVCEPASKADEEPCAEQILSGIMRRAYRRPVTARDLAGPMALFRRARANEDLGRSFDAGVEMALSAVLVSPEFLFRVERDPAGAESGDAYELTDLELASRLSFFLWSSIPDDGLLDAAEAGKLSEPGELERQTRRMLDDERSANLIENFGAQWLYLRNLDSTRPDMRLFPDFDDNLRQAFRTETELFLASILREDRSVLDLITADYTFLNERLAKHYDIPHIYGSHFRRVAVDKQSRRGGLLRQGSILTVTSYATRTSPVIRGKWVLDNLLGIPPPPPPPDVPALEENEAAANAKTIRERLAAHRDNAACRGCHQLMDPVGFALETYDAVGRWRSEDAGEPIDSSGSLPDGQAFDGVEGMEKALLERPEVFVGTVAEKLLTFAVGRGVEYHDAPAIRAAVRQAAEDDYRLSSLVVGIVQTPAFRMRTAR